jgi:carboxyl-terminal processing protease
MPYRVFFTGCLSCLLGVGPLPAADPAAPALGPDALARRAWAFTDLVLDRDVEPCTRQEMFLGGVRGLLHAADRQPPADLSRRVSALTTPEQLAALLREVWPPAEGAAQKKTEELEAHFGAGLLAAIPGRPQLIPPNVLKVEEQVAGNRYVGIGIQIRLNEGEHFPQIVDAFRRGTARRGGARADDLIVEVNGHSTHDVPLGQVIDWIRGDEGTAVTMVVRQPKATDKRTLHLMRAKVPFDTVLGFRRQSEETWSYRIDPDQPIAYARIASINSATLHDLRQLERTLRAEACRALVLDLRFSAGAEPGLESAALVADGLLDGGVMWRLRDAHGVKEVRADAECLFRGWPLAVLVNGEPLGVAPEAVAAALQDNGRAVLVGGPGETRVRVQLVGGEPVGVAERGRYVTTLFRLPDNLGAVALRTARVERASRKRDWPVSPDHVVKMESKQREAVWEWHRRQEMSDPPAGARDQPPDDPQLTKAVLLLRDALKSARDAGKIAPKGGK